MNDKKNLEWHEIAGISEVTEILPLPVEVEEHSIAIYKVGEQFHATANLCSHEDAQLSDGYVDGDAIVCPIHQARFHIPTGKVLCAPATENIRTYPLRIENNRILVGISGD